MLPAFKNSDWRVKRVLAAETSMQVLAAAQTVGVDGGVVIGEVGIQQADIQMLARTAALAVKQSACDRRQGMDAGAGIANGQAGKHRSLAGLANHVEDTRVARADKIPSRLSGQRPVLSESGDRTHYDFGIERLDDVVSKPEPFHGTGAEILHHDIHPGDQLLDNAEAGLFSEIDAETFLAEVLLDEVAAAIAFEIGHAAGLVAVGRHLDLDHFGAHLRHHPRHRGSRDILAEVQDLVSAKHVLTLLGHFHNLHDWCWDIAVLNNIAGCRTGSRCPAHVNFQPPTRGDVTRMNDSSSEVRTSTTDGFSAASAFVSAGPSSPGCSTRTPSQPMLRAIAA